MKEAPRKAERENIPRMTEVQNALKGYCVLGCNKRWLEFCLKVFQLSNIKQLAYASCMRAQSNKFHQNGEENFWR